MHNHYMGCFALLASMFIIPQMTLAKSIIIEYQGGVANHTQNIEDIMCPDSKSCEAYIVKNFLGYEFNMIENAFYRVRPRSANFSFIIQRQERPNANKVQTAEQYEQMLHEFELAEIQVKKEIQNLSKIIKENPQTLFAVAAGNGVFMSGLQTQGVALGEKNILYPAAFDEVNMIKVAALDSDLVNVAIPSSLKIAEYSNFGIESVDIAAPVLKNKKGNTLKGTSYATPYIAALAQKISNMGRLSPIEIKEILMKSVYVKNIDAAIAATQDLSTNGTSSLTYQAMFSKKRKDRMELQQTIGDIILVRSGGPVIADVSIMCAHNYLTSQKSHSIEDSCLRAQKELLGENANPAEKLKELWNLRGF